MSFHILFFFFPERQCLNFFLNFKIFNSYMRSQTWTPSHLPPHNISVGHPHAPAPSMLYPASDIDWWFNSYMIVYMLEWHSPKSSHPLPLPLRVSYVLLIFRPWVISQIHPQIYDSMSFIFIWIWIIVLALNMAEIISE